MGLLNMFAKSAPTLLRLPSGSFTVDRNGRVLVDNRPAFNVVLTTDGYFYDATRPTDVAAAT
jgi:hypothetical protein